MEALTDWQRAPCCSGIPLYETMTSIGSCHLLIGGFDGKSTFGNLWWLVPEEDPIAKRFTASPPKDIPENKDVTIANNNVQSALETVEALSDHWRKAIPRSITPTELGPLLRTTNV